MQYKDIDASFRKLSNGSIGEKEGKSAIIQSIQNIILTEEGESLFKDEYCTNISDYLQGTVNIFDSLSLKNEIFKALDNRLEDIIIEENDIIIKPNYDDNVYEISISFRKSSVENEEIVEFIINLNR